MKRPAVQDALSAEQEAFVLEAEALKATAKAAAVQVALDLMRNAKSENVRARMVEFLLSDGRQAATQVSVAVDARRVSGYEFVPHESTTVGYHD